MMKNVYEMLDDIDAAPTKKLKMVALQNNLCKVLADVFMLTYHPGYQWLISELPHTFQFSDIPPGMGYMQLSTELRKFYLFRRGDPGAAAISEKRRQEILYLLLKSLEPREAEVVMGIFRKDLGVNGVDYNFIKGAFPNMLP